MNFTSDSIALAVLVLLFLSENDEKAPKDGDDVDEEIDAMPNKVVISATTLLYDQLSVIQNAAAHHRQPQIQLHRIKQARSHEKVGPFVSVKRRQTETDEDDRSP